MLYAVDTRPLMLCNTHLRRIRICHSPTAAVLTCVYTLPGR
jgi:hypothetical protein